VSRVVGVAHEDCGDGDRDECEDGDADSREQVRPGESRRGEQRAESEGGDEKELDRSPTARRKAAATPSGSSVGERRSK
jgi:hypothetical protein